MENVVIKPIEDKNKKWVVSLLEKEWNSVYIVSRGKKHNASILPGFIYVQDNKPVGLITYIIENNECEIVTLNSLLSGKGIGDQLIEEVKKAAKQNNCKRIWLITTNDNTKALNFYQKRGFRLVALYPDALKESRKLKPEIPLIGIDGIPLHDEIKLEISLP